MDWDARFFGVWEQGENAGTEPTYEDYQDYLFDRTDLVLGDG